MDVRNLAGIRALEKSGIRREGTLRQGKRVSVYCDYHIYGLLKTDRKGENYAAI
ncbi:MAG: GNAT family N-acetyltransferase [Clostridia bacterium]|nr:GNAT family N-acetyltransferase [Clostridia bacterium]